MGCVWDQSGCNHSETYLNTSHLNTVNALALIRSSNLRSKFPSWWWIVRINEQSYFLSQVLPGHPYAGKHVRSLWFTRERSTHQWAVDEHTRFLKTQVPPGHLYARKHPSLLRERSCTHQWTMGQYTRLSKLKKTSSYTRKHGWSLWFVREIWSSGQLYAFHIAYEKMWIIKWIMEGSESAEYP